MQWRSFSRLLLWVSGMMLLAGCAGVARGSWGIGVLLLALLGMTGFLQTQTSCAPPTLNEGNQEGNPDGDGGNQKDGVEVTKEETVEGAWQTCCENGKISTCFCPAGMACNYGWFTDCGGGVCIATPNATCDSEVVPEGQPESTAESKPESMAESKPESTTEVQPEGTWQTCCENGKISTCFCPAEMACNYGWFTDCGAGTCIPDPRGTCPGEVIPEGQPETSVETKPEMSVEVQPEGTWESCCQNGKVSTCFCPAGVACNYGWFTDCGSGVCVMPNQVCPKEPIPEATPEGTWESCCQNGKISTCFCPAGVACNYGWYISCPNNTCVMPGTSCP